MHTTPTQAWNEWERTLIIAHWHLWWHGNGVNKLKPNGLGTTIWAYNGPLSNSHTSPLNGSTCSVHLCQSSVEDNDVRTHVFKTSDAHKICTNQIALNASLLKFVSICPCRHHEFWVIFKFQQVWVTKIDLAIKKIYMYYLFKMLLRAGALLGSIFLWHIEVASTGFERQPLVPDFIPCDSQVDFSY